MSSRHFRFEICENSTHQLRNIHKGIKRTKDFKFYEDKKSSSYNPYIHTLRNFLFLFRSVSFQNKTNDIMDFRKIVAAVA